MTAADIRTLGRKNAQRVNVSPREWAADSPVGVLLNSGSSVAPLMPCGPRMLADRCLRVSARLPLSSSDEELLPSPSRSVERTVPVVVSSLKFPVDRVGNGGGRREYAVLDAACFIGKVCFKRTSFNLGRMCCTPQRHDSRCALLTPQFCTQVQQGRERMQEVWQGNKKRYMS